MTATYPDPDLKKRMGKFTRVELELLWKQANEMLSWLRRGSKRHSQHDCRRAWREVRNLATTLWKQKFR